MTIDDRHPPLLARALVGLYPHHWRRRYGDELAEVLTSAMADGRRRPRLALDSAVGALDAHIHPSLIGGHVPMTDRLRSSTSTAFAAFTAFVVAAGGFAKMTEDQLFSSAAGEHRLIGWSYRLVMVAAVTAAVAVAAGGLPIVLHIGRQARAGRRDLLRLLLIPPVSVVVLLAVMVGASRLAGHRGTQVHTAASVSLFLLIVAVGVAAAALCAVSAVAAVRRADLPAGLLRHQVVPMAALSMAMTLTSVAALVWGLALRSSNPALFHSDNGLVATGLPASWLFTVAAMALATAVATRATVRSFAALREGPSAGAA